MASQLHLARHTGPVVALHTHTYTRLCLCMLISLLFRQVFLACMECDLDLHCSLCVQWSRPSVHFGTHYGLHKLC